MADSAERRQLEAAVTLHRLLVDRSPEGNLAWSPYSVLSALGLAAEGARGATRTELQQAIGASLPELARLLTEASALEGSRIAVTNTLWANLGLPIHDSYEAAVRGWPGGAAGVVDFAGAPDRARQTINADVEKTTHGIIRALLGPTDVTSDTLAVLVNAVWLRLIWAEPFDVQRTKPRPFHAPDRGYDTPTMSKVATLPYAETDGWRQVSLRAEGDVRCDLLLPDDPGAVTVGPSAAVLGKLRTKLSATKVDLRLPRFDIGWRSGLNDVLAAAGVRTLFTGDADLSGISGVPLKVDKVVHQAALQLDEEGAEGAAATAVVMTRAAFGRERDPVRFWVDRPFLAIMRHRPTGAVYFVARVTNP